MRRRSARSRYRVIGVVGALPLIVLMGVWTEGRLHPGPGRVDFDGVDFQGGNPYQRHAVGEFIEAVRRNSLPALLTLDDQPDTITQPTARRDGATWVLTYYGDRLGGPVRVRFEPPVVSERELTGCLSFGRQEHLVVLGMRHTDTPSYRIMLDSFPMEPVEAAARCGVA